jgi:protein TonB
MSSAAPGMRPLLVATVLALGLHLLAALAFSLLAESPRPRATPIEAVGFELLPTIASPAPVAAPQPVVPPLAAEDAPDASAMPAPEPPPTPVLPAPEPAPEPVLQRQVSAARILASRNQVLAGFTRNAAELQPGRTQRRRTLNASTQEYVYANYLESWRRKVERIGNLNYPEEAKEKHLYGSLMLQVAVRADGSLENVRVLRSSGHQVLDDAAVRIVELAAPFAPFPDDIRARHDVLDIVRTWQFLRNQRLGWGK